jgi:hypothetical protein
VTGSDTLTGIEKLQFSDQTFILSRAAHDYNGDGKSDTMWRYTDGSTSLWLMNGTSVQTYGSFGAIPTAWEDHRHGRLQRRRPGRLAVAPHGRQHQPVADERHQPAGLWLLRPDPHHLADHHHRRLQR